MVCATSAQVQLEPACDRKVERVTPDQWRAVEVLVVEGHTYAEIARRLGMRESTVRMGAIRKGWKPRETKSVAELQIEEKVAAKRVAWVEKSLETWEVLAETVARGVKKLAACADPCADSTSTWSNTWSKVDAGARAALGLDSSASGRMVVNSSRTNILVK